MRAALVTGMMAVVVCLGGAPVKAHEQAQVQQVPRRPTGPGGAVGGVPRPDPATGQPRRPVRDPRQPAAEGTATIRGRVVDGATGAAIPRAKVRTANRDQRSARVATTDTEGVFTLTKVTPGPLTLMVEKAAYLPANYPERRRSMRGSNLDVADGQTIDNITVPLFRGGAITGRIIDAYGDPVENVMVQAIPVAQNNRSMSSPRFGGRSVQSSNDIGEFRVSKLEPGQYYLLAMPQRRPDSLEDGANAPGRTYYPGVASIDQAQPITLERGTSMAGLDFPLLDTSLTKVSGIVLNAKGGPARNGHVSARATSATKGTPPGWGGFMGDGGGASVDPSGAFQLMLQPGEYIIEGMAPQGDENPPQGRFEMDRGSVRLVVGSEPISGVTIATGAGGAVSGRFVFKGTSTPPTSFRGFNIGFGGPNGMMGDDCRASGRPTVNPDGTFSAENIWGTCQIRGGGMAKGWTFEAVMHNGNDITNRVIEFGAGRSMSGVEIVYTDRVGDINVTVADESGQPVQGYVTVAFPVEKEKWSDARFLRFQVMSEGNSPNAGAPATASRVAATGMPPMVDFASGATSSMMIGPNVVTGSSSNAFRTLLAGDYFVVALEDAAFDDLRDPEYLERLSQMATRVTLSPGGTQAVQLRRVKAPE